MSEVKITELTEKTAPHKDDLLYLVDMENNIDKKVKYGTIRPYKVYTALISKVGTDPVTAIILENTLGVTPVWGRSDVGRDNFKENGFFKANKTFIIFRGLNSLNDTIIDLYAEHNSTDYIDLISVLYSDESFGSFDYNFSNLPFEVRVYN